MNQYVINRPLITVVIPVYKVEQYLDRCLNSVLSQTYAKLEIILIDDGSPDSCPQMCDDYTRKDYRISVIHKKNNGLSSARNTGITIARGEYITFIDGDDYILPDMIEQLFTTLITSNTEISICSFTSEVYDLEYGIKTEYKTFLPEEAMKEIFAERAFHTTACAKLYMLDLFRDICFPEGLLYEDYATIYKLFDHSKNISFVDTAKYYYTYNAEGITKALFSEKQMDYFIISNEVMLFVNTSYPKLKKYVQNRDTNYAITLYRKMCLSNYKNKTIIQSIVQRIRNSILYYQFSNYPLIKKVFGLVIALEPQFAKIIILRMI